MIYLDNAATSFPKPAAVNNAVYECMTSYCANPGRGGHSLSIKAGRAVIMAREKISAFFNILNPMQMIFTKNATEALNTAIKGYLSYGAHVITTCMEHNSVMRPLKTLEKDMGIGLTIIEGDKFGLIDPLEIKKSIKKRTSLIISTLSSNVNGTIMPVKEIGKISKEAGVSFLLDASQGAGVLDIDVQAQNIDLLAFPGHKGLLGPQGTGGLYVSEGVKLKSIYEGGTGSNSESIYQPDFMPDYLESGTVNTPGIIGLGEGIEFLNSVGIEKIREHKNILVNRLIQGVSEIDKVTLYSKSDIHENSGIVAINIEGMDSTEISLRLDKEYDVATRAGLHCAPMPHRTLGTLETGAVRLSPGYFNTIEQIDTVIEALIKISAEH